MTCRQERRVLTSRLRAFALALYCLSLLGCGGGTIKTSLKPQDTKVDGLLAEAAARFAMPDAPQALDVLDDVQAEYSKDNTLTVTVRQVWASRVKPRHAVKPLAVINPDVQEFKVLALRRYTLQPDGTFSHARNAEIISEPPARDLPNPLSRITAYRLPAMEAGEALEVLYTLRTLPPALPRNDARSPGNRPPSPEKDATATVTPTPEPVPLAAEPSFSYLWNDHVPSLKRELTIRTPKGLLLYGSRLRLPAALKTEQTPDGLFQITRFTLDGFQEALPLESFQPPIEDLAGVTAFTPYSTWDKALEPYRRRIKAYAVPTSRLETLVADASSNTTEALETRLARVKRALHDAVAWVDTGLPVYLNHDRNVDDILESGKGSSHDMAVLLTAALRAMNLPGEVHLYRRGDRGALMDQTPALSQFDGVLVGTTVRKNWTWMDPTESLSPPGILPLEALSANALSVKPGITWRDTPPFTAKDNRRERDVLLQIQSDGSAECRVVLQAYGSSEVSLRQFFRSRSPADRKRIVEQGMSKRFHGVTLSEYRYGDYRDLADPLKVEYRFRLPSYLETDRKGAPVFYPIVFEDISDFLSALKDQRRTTAVLPQNYNSVTRVVVNLPPRWRVKDLPPDGSVSNDSAEFLSHAKIDFGTLSYERYMGLKRRTIRPGNEYKDLLDFYKGVLKQDRTPFAITLPPASKQAPKK